MKPAAIHYTPAARQYLRHLHPSIKSPLRSIIEELAQDPLQGKPLRDELTGFRSHRLRSYRVIYRYLEPRHCVEVVFAGPRRDVYEIFARFLKAGGAV